MRPSALSTFSWFAALGLTVGLAQEVPPRAGVVEEALRIDPASAFLERAKNVYDAAQANQDERERRELYLRASTLLTQYLQEFGRHPNAEAAWWYLGNCHYQTGMLDDAKRCFSTLMNGYPDGKYAAAAAYTLAVDHYNKGEYAFAAPLFEKFAAKGSRASDRARSRFLAGNCYRLTGRDRDATKAYQEVIKDAEAAAVHDPARLALGHLTLKAGKTEDALKLFEEVARSGAPDQVRAEASLHAAISATKLGKADEAEKYLREVLEKPGMEAYRSDAQIALMEHFFTAGKYKEVVELYAAGGIKAEGEKEAVRLMVVARAMLQIRKATDAGKLFREIERMVPPESDLAFQAAYYRLNCAFQIEGKFVTEQVDAFLQIYEKARPKDPRIHTALLIKAETLFSQNKIPSAAEVFARIDPELLTESNRPGFLFQRGWCLSEAGDPQGAIVSLSDFIKRYPKDDRVHVALAKRAKSHADIGEPAKAVTDYDLIATDQTAPQELVTMAWLESARTRRKEGNIENMLLRYRSLLEVKNLGENLAAEAKYWVGWGLVKTNKPKDAVAFLNEARKLRKDAYGKHAGLLLALSHFSAQDPEQLASEIERAMQDGYVGEIPAQAIQWTGMQCYNARDYAAAAKYLSLTVNDKEPRATPKEVWRYLGKSLLENGKAQEALKAIGHVLEVEDQPAWKADGLLDQARAYYLLQKFDESRQSTDASLALRPQGRTSAGLRVISGDLHAQKGRFSEAAADYLYVIQFQEDADLKPLAIYRYAALLEKQGKKEESDKYKAQLKTDFPAWKATQ